MGLLVGIDIGGTFTDITAVETATGELTITKVPSTPGNFAQGFFNGLDKILDRTSASFTDVARLVHGTTVATNSIAEQRGAKIGILTTKGFGDALLIGWGSRTLEDNYSTQYDSIAPRFLCDRERIMEIRERVDFQGNVVTPLNEDDVVQAVDYLVQKRRVEAIAVSYLFNFLNPAHERRTEEIIRGRYPKVRVSLSSIVNPRFREYERMVITAFDAYVGPEMERYIRELEEGMHNRRINVVLQVMQSRGGITSAAMCAEKPVVTLLSGPAGGVIGANFISSLCERQNLITLDMGGTTCDVALIRHRKPYLFIEGKLFAKYPLRQAMLDITSIGAGGGSIARVDAAGGMQVGPHSAGADPGPACYGRGGKEPTVTDASIVLGYLNPEYFAAGELTLNPELAREAINEHIAKPLGIDVTKAAAGIHQIVNNNMADELRLVSVNKGHHPRDFSLVAFGGAGPVAAGRLMHLLGLKETIIPVSPGVLAALGLLAADIEHEEVVSFPVREDKVDPKDIEKVFRKAEAMCEQKREGVGISETLMHVHHSAEMRYVHQGYELEVPFPEGRGEITREIINDVIRRFHEVHQSIYQHCSPEKPVEFIAFRTVFSQKPKLLPVLPKLSSSIEATPKGWRQAYFDEYQSFVDTPLYERRALALGQIIKGPAIVEQEDTTTIIYPSQQAEVDDLGNLIIAAIQ